MAEQEETKPDPNQLNPKVVAQGGEEVPPRTSPPALPDRRA